MRGDYLIEIVDNGLGKFADVYLVDDLSCLGLRLRDLHVVDDLRDWKFYIVVDDDLREWNFIDNLCWWLLGNGDLVDDLGWCELLLLR